MSEEYYVGYMEIDEALKTIRRGLAKRFGNIGAAWSGKPRGINRKKGE